MKLLLTLLALSLPAFSATTVGPSGEGITSGTRSAFLTALGGSTAGKAIFAIGNGTNGYILQSNGSGGVSWVTATGGNLTSGPVTSSGGVSAIANGAITNAMLANGAVANLSGTNTGDNSANTTYASDFRAANFVAGTNYLAPNGDATNLTNLPAANLTGTVNLARLVKTETVDGTAAGPTTITAGTRDVIVSPGVSGAKTFILPGATTALGYPAGARITFTDMLNSLSSSNTATLQPASGGYINNVLNGTMVLTTAGASTMLISDGAGRWNVDIQGVPRGGIGTTSLSGIAKGNGTAPFTAAVAGTDYVVPSGSITGSAATLATPRTIMGYTGFNGSANIGQDLQTTASPTFAGTTINTNGTVLTLGSGSASDVYLSVAGGRGVFGYSNASNATYVGNTTTKDVVIGNGGYGIVARFSSAGLTTLSGTLAVTGTSTLTGGIVLPTSTTPASASASGVAGTVCWDASFIYVCTATNTWKRVVIATW